MDFKKEIESILNSLKSHGMDRRAIEKKLGYSENAIDQSLARGGSKKIYSSLQILQELILNNSTNEDSGENKIEDTSEPYIDKRRKKKLKNEETLSYYEIGAAAGTAHSAEILPVKKSDGVLHISDLFKGSEYAIRVSGNSMTPNYPSGCIIGIREIHDKQISPGSVYIIEKESDLWIKRVFYKDDNQDSGYFELVSDNTMKHENGPRQGKLCYPPFNIEIDAVRKLFKVTGIYKANELTVIK